MNAAIYIRKSREEKDKPSHRLTVQREQLPAYAVAQGWTFEIYDDGHASAARGKTEDLKERGRLEADIRTGKINTILTIELSRLSRDDSLQDYVAWLHLCAERKVKLSTMSRSLDPSQHSDWMLLLMEGGFSSVEMRVLKGRMKDGYDQAYREGRFLGGSPPPPYVYDPKLKKPVIDPEQLPKVRRIWEMAETMSAISIATELSIPQIAVRRAISDNRLLWYQSLRSDPFTGEHFPCEWEACMDAEQAARVRAGRRTRVNGTDRRPYAALFSNLQLLYCGYCTGAAKTWQNSRVKKDGTRNDYYGCQTKNVKNKCAKARLIPQGILHDKVLVNLFNTIEGLEQIKEYWELQQQDNNPVKEIEALAKKEQREKEKKARLVSAIGEGVLEFAEAKTEMGKINLAIEQLAAERRALTVQAATPPDWSLLEMTREEFEQLPVDEQREFLQIAIERITIYENYAVITYPFPRNIEGSREARVHFPAKQDGYIMSTGKTART
jgi:DNA invertase Pin-like site-specific DNA recombinase